MDSVQKIWVALIAVAIIAIMGLFSPAGQQAVSMLGGSACNGGNCTDYDAVNTSAGYYVDDSQVIDGGGAWIGFYGAGDLAIDTYAANATSASTTVCAIQNPNSATSSISAFSFQVTTATSTAISWVIGTTTSPYATSSGMVSATLSANEKGAITYAPVSRDNVIGPSEYVVVGTGANTGLGLNTGGVIFAGNCTGVFQTI